jgi:hypothetical protein
MAKLSCPVAARWVLISFDLQIYDVYWSLVEEGTSEYKPTRQAERNALGDWPMVGEEAEIAAVQLTDCRVMSIAKSRSACGDLREYGLSVSR